MGYYNNGLGLEGNILETLKQIWMVNYVTLVNHGTGYANIYYETRNMGHSEFQEKYQIITKE